MTEDVHIQDDFVGGDTLLDSLTVLAQGDPAVAPAVAELWAGANVRSLDELDPPVALLTTALDTVRRALVAAPEAPALYLLLGLLEWQRGELQAAFRALNRLRSPNAAADGLTLTARLALRRILRQRGDRLLADRLLSELLQHQPESFRGLLGLGRELSKTEHHALAIRYLDRALAMRPDHPLALSLAAASRMLSGQLDELATITACFTRLLEVEGHLRDYSRAAFWAPYLGLPPAFEQRCWARIRASVAAYLRTIGTPLFQHRSRRHRRLRLGYISPAFGDHPIGHVTFGVYAAHDRTRFEIFLYPTKSRELDHSVYRQHILASADHVRPLQGLSPRAMATVIHADEIDILIDLHGHMGTRNILACALRPAPVQLYWLGHGGGLGLSCYDGIIGDPTVTPMGEDSRYLEAVLRLPRCFQPGSPHPIAEDTPTRMSEGLADGAFVFCAFNHPAKICPEVFALWMRLLRDRPHSQLWLTHGRNPDLPRNLRRHAQTQGVDPDRLVFAQRLPDKRQHLARHRLADLFLDTFTFNAATTCLDALWSGVPVLTRPGNHFCSRIAASMLATAGLEELICDSSASYFATALALAQDPQRLAALKRRVQAARCQSPLFDIPRFVRGLEEGLLRAWEGRNLHPPTP